MTAAVAVVMSILTHDLDGSVRRRKERTAQSLLTRGHDRRSFDRRQRMVLLLLLLMEEEVMPQIEDGCAIRRSGCASGHDIDCL